MGLRCTFERADEMEDVLGDGYDFGADAVAGKQSDIVAYYRWGGGAADRGEFV